MKIFSFLGTVLVVLYQGCISPFKVPCCRFQPTCSNYAKEALQKHNFFFALYLITRRLLRCNPWGKSGYDPVPEPKRKRKIKNENRK